MPIEPIYRRDYFGFVYVWYDRVKKMLYVGSHMGSWDDGYICSSMHMNAAYRRRPSSFMRRIVYWHPSEDRESLLREEVRWLSMIEVKELGGRYYNRIRIAGGGAPRDSAAYREKLSRASKAHWLSPAGEEHRARVSEGSRSLESREKRREAMRARWADPAFREKMSRRRRGVMSEEGRESVRRYASSRVLSEETRRRMSESAKRRITPEWAFRQAALMREQKRAS